MFMFVMIMVVFVTQCKVHKQKQNFVSCFCLLTKLLTNKNVQLRLHYMYILLKYTDEVCSYTNKKEKGICSQLVSILSEDGVE